MNRAETRKAAIASARQVTAYYRSAEQAVIAGHLHFAAHLGSEGLAEAGKATALLLKLGDPNVGRPVPCEDSLGLKSS